MSFLHFLQPGATRPLLQPGDLPTASEQRIAAQLSALPAEQAAHVAAYGYILTRVALADLAVSAAETAAMERAVSEFGGLPAELAVTVVAIAVGQASRLNGTEDFLVTRRFRELTTLEERERLLHALFAVAAPGDDTISFEEGNVIREVADELGFSLAELNVVRRTFADRMTAVRRVHEVAGDA